MSLYVLGWLSRKQRLGRGSGGTGIIMASAASDSRLHGGREDMLELEAVLPREVEDWLVAVRRSRALAGRGASVTATSKLRWLLKQLNRMIEKVCEG